MAKSTTRLNLADKLAAELAANPVIVPPPRDSDRTDHTPHRPLAAQATNTPPISTTDTIDHQTTLQMAEPATPPPDHMPKQSPASDPHHPQSSGHSANNSITTSPPAHILTGHTPSEPHASPSSDPSITQTNEPERTEEGVLDRARASSVKPCRVDMMRVSGFFSEQVKYQIQQLQWKYSQTTEEEMVGQALNLLFRYEGMPEIAFEGKDTRKRPVTLRPPKE
jgi:hypothetical protein